MLFYASDLDPDNDLKLDFQDLLQKTMKMVKLKKKLGGIIKSDKKNSQVSNLVNRCDEEVFISFSPNAFAPFSDSIFKPFIAASSANFITKPEDKNIKQLTKII